MNDKEMMQSQKVFFVLIELMLVLLRNVGFFVIKMCVGRRKEEEEKLLPSPKLTCMKNWELTGDPNTAPTVN